MMWYDLFGVSVHSVCANSEYGGMLAAAGFIRKGHRKLAVIASEPRNHDIVDRIAGFVNTARLFGAEAVEIPCEIHSGDYSTGCAHDAIILLFVLMLLFLNICPRTAAVSPACSR